MKPHKEVMTWQAVGGLVLNPRGVTGALSGGYEHFCRLTPSPIYGNSSHNTTPSKQVLRLKYAVFWDVMPRVSCKKTTSVV
jgi:hypothetical protein